MRDIDRRQSLIRLLGAVAAGHALPSRAETRFPTRPVTLIVPQPAGGGADALCRSLQADVQKTLGQPVIIENRGGAAGNFGTAFGLKATPDGHTVTFVNLSTMALNPHLYTNTGYSVAEMQPVIWLASVANLIAVNPERVKAKTMAEFIAEARRNPGKLTYATAGNGSGNHLGGEMLKKMAGIDLLHVPYKGGAPALNALLGGEVDAAVADPLAVLPHIRAGKIRALAVTSAKRASSLPEVPTVAESGVPGYEAASWAGIVAPKGTPTAVVETLYHAFQVALKSPEVAARLSSQLYEPVGAGPQQFARFATAEDQKWAKLIKQIDIKLE